MGRDYPPVETGRGAHTAYCTMGTGPFSGLKSGRGVTLNTHPLLVLRSWKSRAISLPTLWVTPRPVTGTLYIFPMHIPACHKLTTSNFPASPNLTCVNKHNDSCFDVLLTVHYSNDQFWFQHMHRNFTLLTKSLYMFRAPTCPSSGGQTIYIHTTTGSMSSLMTTVWLVPTNHTVVIRDDIEQVVVYI